MYKKKSRWLKHIDFTITDMLCIELAFVVAYWARHGWQSPYDTMMYRQIGILLFVFDVCIVFFAESYKNILRRGKLEEFKSVLKQSTLLVGCVLVYMFITQQSEGYSRMVFLLFWINSTVMMYGMRLLLKQWIRLRIVKGEKPQEVLLITKKAYVVETINRLRANQYTDYELIGVVIMDAAMTGSEEYSIPVVADSETLFSYVKTNVVDTAFVYLPNDEEEIEKVMNNLLLMGVTVHISLLSLTQNTMEHTVTKFGGYTVLTSSVNMATERQLMMKRTMDICGGLVGLLVTGLLFIVFAPVIYIQSPGPIFFSQDRVGLNGRIFKIYKFRSMYPDAEQRKKELMDKNQMQGLMFKMEDDPRVIPIGKFIRETSIDEFPQFFNVLKGDMSLVGTRPPTVEEYEQYEMHHKARLCSKPGITGLWQVSGRSDITDFEEVVALDAKYISEWKLGLDIKILFKTVAVVFEKKGSF